MNVLVAVDFSDNSRVAASFSARLAAETDGSVHLVHNIRPIEDDFDLLPVATMQARKNTVSEMYGYQEALRRQHGVRSGCSIVPGDFTKGITRVAREEKSDLVVMGAQGESGLRRYLYGSNVTSFLSSSPLPLIVLPEKTVHFRMGRVVFYPGNRLSNIKLFAEALKLIPEEITECAVLQDGESLLSPAEEQAVEEALPLAKRVTFPVYGGTVAALREYLKATPCDLLVVPRDQKEVLSCISGRSVTNFEFDIDIPLMVIPA